MANLIIPDHLTDEESARLQANLLRDEATGCLLWTGGKNSDGYGKFWLRGRYYKPHRVTFVLSGGNLTAERPCVLHSCDTPSCCEPSHLSAGSHDENLKDMAKKGRGPKSKAGLPFGTARHPGGRFKAQIRMNGKLLSLGLFSTLDEASAVAAEARRCRNQGFRSLQRYHPKEG